MFMKKTKKPKLALVSVAIRRDLQEPLKFFKSFEVFHFYSDGSCGDLTKDDFNKRTIQYRGFVDLLRKIIKLRPDLIQGSEPYGFPNTLRACLGSFFASLLLRCPFYFPMLENRPVAVKFGQKYSFLPSLLTFYLRLYSKRASLIINVNNGALRSLKEAGVPEKKIARMLYGTWGVNTEEFSPRKSGGEPDWPHDDSLLFVGRFVEEKGVRYLLEAFKLLEKDFPSLRLYLIGKGPLEDYIRQFVEARNLGQKVFLLGFVKNKEIPLYLRAATLTVMPSCVTSYFEEQVGMVAIQSIACGTPVVSTDTGAIPEFVKEGRMGILVPERNAQALAGAIKELLLDKDLREKMSQTGVEEVKEHFDARKGILKVEEKLLELL